MTLVNVLVWAAWVPAVAFWVLHSRTDWRSTIAGRAVWIMSLVVVIALSLSVARRVLNLALPDWVSALAYLLIVVGLWTQLISFLFVRYGQHKDEKSAAERVES